MKLIVCILLVAAGLFVHLVAKMSELENRGQQVNAWAYLTEHPWTTLNVVLGAYGLLLFAYYTGELGPVGSFSFGVVANVAGDKLRARALAKVNAIEETNQRSGV